MIKSILGNDHLGYLRQEFEVGSLNYFLEILESEILNGFDVIEVFCVSKFIASYEISLEYVQSGMVLLIRRLTHGLYLDSSREDEDLLIIDLVERYHLACLMGTGGSLQFQNPGLNEHIETNSWVNVDATIFSLIKNISSSHNGPLMMSVSIGILSRMLKWGRLTCYQNVKLGNNYIRLPYRSCFMGCESHSIQFLRGVNASYKS
ncbi:uncharacterized protein LOC124912263 isoform X6 [Impatiens glandulifera]|uniref:uncharacterized protein LOC124912263 isoform X6 n=1 Tax=Impatiens glandulifera TaxID=253017 RepID=UPI001FB0D789|nr:uncharacterized protein LOC124912263 isoform X6 [Impatiens glandulifera]